MICPKCSNGFLSPSLPRPLVLSYRGFSKEVASQIVLECTFCSNELTRLCKGVDIDHEWCIFKREVNIKLSGGDEL